MGKAINELDNAGALTDATLVPVGETDTLKKSTWAAFKSAMKTYIEGAIGTAQFRALLDDATAADQRTTLGLGDSATKNTGTTAGTVAAGDDSRLSDSRTPTSHTHALADLTQSSASTGQVATWNGSAWAPATPSAGGSPGGSNTQVQVNSSGAFTGYSTFTCNASGNVASNKLTLASQSQFALSFAGRASVGLDGSNDVLAFLSSSDYALCVNHYNSAIAASSAYFYGWSSTTTPSGTVDTAFKRNAAGVVEINSGTAGTFRDLKLRNLIASGNLATGVVSKTANYTATTNDGTIEFDATSGPLVNTLFPCANNAGKILVIKKTDSSANAVTIDANASETIDGATTVSLASQYSTITIQVNAAGTAWHKISGV